MDIKNKVVVITGASTGIGKELGFEFSKRGCPVALAARNAEQLNENVATIQKRGAKAIAVPTDVAKRSEVENLMKRTFDAFGRIDIVINNAGISPAKGTLLENSEKDIRDTMDVNYMGCVYGTWAAVPYLEKGGGGQLVYVSSIIGKRGIAKNAAYCASKFAVQGLTESIRPELAPKNIRVITICPPGVDTPFYEKNGKSNVQRYRLHPADKIARMIVSACENEKREVLLTMDAKLLHLANLMFPKILDRAIGKVKGVTK